MWVKHDIWTSHEYSAAETPHCVKTFNQTVWRNGNAFNMLVKPIFRLFLVRLLKKMRKKWIRPNMDERKKIRKIAKRCVWCAQVEKVSNDDDDDGDNYTVLLGLVRINSKFFSSIETVAMRWLVFLITAHFI